MCLPQTHNTDVIFVQKSEFRARGMQWSVQGYLEAVGDQEGDPGPWSCRSECSMEMPWWVHLMPVRLLHRDPKQAPNTSIPSLLFPRQETLGQVPLSSGNTWMHPAPPACPILLPLHPLIRSGAEHSLHLSSPHSTSQHSKSSASPPPAVLAPAPFCDPTASAPAGPHLDSREWPPHWPTFL